MNCLVGLGNPGKKYEYTRHNIGALVAKTFARRLGWAFKEEKRLHALVAKGNYNAGLLHIVLPTTYMNESGRCVQAYMSFHKLKAQELLVVSDDVELPFGTLRFREKGGSGGHNGLKSIQAHIHTQEYARLKMGVGKDVQEGTLADYVLDVFTPEEFAGLASFVDKGADQVKQIIEGSDPLTGDKNESNKTEPL